MAAGDRRSNGKPKDIVRHYKNYSEAVVLCGRLNFWYTTKDVNDVTCKSCLKLIKKRYIK